MSSQAVLGNQKPYRKTAKEIARMEGQAIPELKRILRIKPGSTSQRGHVFFVLSKMPTLDVVKLEIEPVLIEMVGHVDGYARLGAMRLLNQIDPFWVDDHIGPVRKLIDDPNSLVRDEVIFTLAYGGSAAIEAVPDLLEIIADPKAGSNSRLMAMYAIPRIAPSRPDVVRAIENAIDDGASGHLILRAVQSIKKPPDSLVRHMLAQMQGMKGEGELHFPTKLLTALVYAGPARADVEVGKRPMDC